MRMEGNGAEGMGIGMEGMEGMGVRMDGMGIIEIEGMDLKE